MLGMRISASLPACIMGVMMIGFGAFARANDIERTLAVLSTIIVWSVPGQIILVESLAQGIPVLAISISIGVANARFGTMCLALAPYLRFWQGNLLKKAAFAHMVVTTPWLVAMNVFPSMPEEDRIPFFVGFSVTNMAAWRC